MFPSEGTRKPSRNRGSFAAIGVTFPPFGARNESVANL